MSWNTHTIQGHVLTYDDRDCAGVVTAISSGQHYWFHTTGCSGFNRDPRPGDAVDMMMADDNLISVRKSAAAKSSQSQPIQTVTVTGYDISWVITRLVQLRDSGRPDTFEIALS